MPTEVPPERVRTRRDLEEYLGQSLIEDYLEQTPEGGTRQVATSLKTYLVEHHGNPDPESLRHAFVRVHPTDDRTLFLAWDKKDVPYFVDMQDERFPFVHSIGKTNDTDQAVRRLTTGAGFDRCWFSSRMMLEHRLGHMIGFRFFHQRLLHGLSDSEAARDLAEDLRLPSGPAFRMNVSEYAGAEEDLTVLREMTNFGRRAALDSLSWRTSSRSEEGTRSFIHDHVWASGKISAYGTSYSDHINNAMIARDRYRNAISRLESEVSLQWEGGGLRGVPVQIALGDRSPINDLGAFASDLCSTREPFRLAGTWDYINLERIVIHAVDLHMKAKLTVELHREFVTLYLPWPGCANVLLRLLVNFERHLSSELSTTFDDLVATLG